MAAAMKSRRTLRTRRSLGEAVVQQDFFRPEGSSKGNPRGEDGPQDEENEIGNLPRHAKGFALLMCRKRSAESDGDYAADNEGVQHLCLVQQIACFMLRNDDRKVDDQHHRTDEHANRRYETKR